MNTLFMQALLGTNKNRPPVWLMRQAGRYMPEYRQMRQKASFLELCYNPDLVEEVTLLPKRLLGIDALILFSDILLIAQAWGLDLSYHEQKGPKIAGYLNPGDAHLRELPVADIDTHFAFLKKAIAKLVGQDLPLIGFSGGPFTLASYLIEGGTSRDFRLTKKWLYNDPQGFHRLLQQITDGLSQLLALQADAGASAVQIFESWAHTLSTPLFEEFCLPYIAQMVERLQKASIPHLVFCRGSSIFYPQIAALKPTGIGLDWHLPLNTVRRHVPLPTSLQGNLDPCLLYAPQPVIRQEVKRLIASMQNDPGFIVNLGHGILPDVPFDSVKCLVDTVKEMGA